MAPREGLGCLVDEDGPYWPTSTATPWAAGRQVWGPPFPERRQKTPKLSVNNNNDQKIKHLRRNVPSETQVVPLPHATDIRASKKKHFAPKFKKGTIKHGCTDKFHKLDKNLKFARRNKTMEILQDKSKLRETFLLVKDVTIPDPNTMKSNDTASSSSPCPSSMEAMIPKSTFHGN